MAVFEVLVPALPPLVAFRPQKQFVVALAVSFLDSFVVESDSWSSDLVPSNVCQYHSFRQCRGGPQA